MDLNNSCRKSVSYCSSYEFDGADWTGDMEEGRGQRSSEVRGSNFGGFSTVR